MSNIDKVIIGGGAAGMMAAVSTARMGKSVVLIEKNDRLGKKLAITGKGRCNVTNDCTAEEFFENVPTNARFLYSAFYSFTNEDVKNFFEDLGVRLKTERGKRVFPESDRAADIVNALKNEMKRLGVKLVQDRAKKIDIRNARVCGVFGEKGYYKSDAVLIASGGMSYPKTGSTGDGYEMAKEAGHSVTRLYPSLIPLEAEGVAHLAGLSLKNVSVDVLDGRGKRLYTDFGEMLFTHFGVSGPIILSASGYMRGGEGYKIIIDLKPALDEAALDARILRDFEKYKNRDFINALGDLLPQKLIGEVIRRAGIDERKKVNSLTREERRKLRETIKGFEVKITGTRPIDEAIVTSGGVEVKEINASTMESKLIKGLYFAGEVIDCDAYTGGFNLQIAFSTGHLAGVNM
ncbi:MAG: NAD(P)/FAD-dependent oxidoreductase [Clostridia bacterium]|nr:NAD(P)/FAD-dependent oxidoreductase [Clostridia bacterium]